MSARFKTRALAELLRDEPKIVQRVFELGVDPKNQPVEIAVQINKEYSLGFGEGEPELTDYYVRQLFHRNTPFNNPDLYKLVNMDHSNTITSRFRGQIKSGPRKKRSKPNNGGCMTAHIPLLMEVLKTRLEYQNMLNKAIDAGMDKASVVAWCSVVADGGLNK